MNIFSFLKLHRGLRESRGFTLIELLVVISIIALLSSIVLASLQTARAKGRDSSRIEAIIQIRNAMELYRVQNGSYPTTGASFSVSGVPTAGVINGTKNTSGVSPTDGCPGALPSVGFNYVAFSGSYYNDNLISGLTPTFISHISNDPSGKNLCMLYASNGNDYKFTEVGVMENTSIGSASNLYDSGFSSTAYSSNSISIYTSGAANWVFSGGEYGGVAP